MTDTMTFEGVARFPSRAGSSYRYKLTASSNSMSVWLEDRESKHQWTSSSLQLSDFVDAKNAISQASITDYVSCFQNCLESTRSKLKTVTDKTTKDKRYEREPEVEADSSSCDLVPLDKETWSLQFVLALKVFTSVWRPTYKISLKSVKLEPIDILAAQLRDVQEQLKQLRAEDSGPPFELHLTTVQNAGPQQLLDWSVVEGDSDHRDDSATCFSVDAGGRVRFLEGGVYVVSLVLHHARNSDYNCYCELQRDGVGIHTCFASESSGVSMMFPFECIVTMRKGQSLTVVNKSRNYVYANSTMKITPLK